MDWIGMVIYRLLSKIAFLIFSKDRLKLFFEYLYWKVKKIKEGNLSNNHYEYFFTEYFGLNKHFYRDKRVLDIGCGPRGSLEWINNSSKKFGLDPLVKKYVKLGITGHQMKYISGCGEQTPFKDNSFDIISSFNSFDHLSNLEKVINEIKRILTPGGIFLLLTDIHSVPLLCEPSIIEWNLSEKFHPEFNVLSECHLEGEGTYSTVRKGKLYDHSKDNHVPGVLTLKLQRVNW